MRADAAIVVGLAGCMAAPPANSGFLCELSPVCPEGQTCVDGVCIVGEPPDGGSVPPPPPPPPPSSRRRSILALDIHDPGEELVDFPLLVKLDNVRADLALLGNGDDLRFFDAGGTVLPHEIEPVSPPGATMLVWVRAPQIKGKTTAIEIDYGRADQVPRATAPVWGGYEAVFHFAETSGDPRDSSPKQRHGVARAGAVPASAGGPIGTSREFRAPETGAIVVNAPDFNPSMITVSGWFQEKTVAGSSQYHVLVARQRGTDGENDIWLGNALGKITAWFGVSGDQAEIAGPSATASMTHLAMTAGPAGARLYINGDPSGAPSSMPFVAGAPNPIVIGADRNNVSSGPPNVDWHDGLIDEVRIESVVRSAQRIKFEHRSMLDQVINYGAVNRDP